MPRPRLPRSPEARSNSTSVLPAAACSAARAAADSGARPRLVCSRTPVALITGVSVAASDGSAAAAVSATAAGSISPALRPVLRAPHGREHDRAAQPLLGRDEPRVGQDGVRAGGEPADVHERDHTCLHATAGSGLYRSS